MLPGRFTKVTAPSTAALARSQRVPNAKLRALGWTSRYPSIRDESVAAIVAADESTQSATTSP